VLSFLTLAILYLRAELLRARHAYTINHLAVKSKIGPKKQRTLKTKRRKLRKVAFKKVKVDGIE